jgi:quercetin dioxygenase-like cupin family protein
MVFYNKDAPLIHSLSGVTRKTLAQSHILMLCEFTFDAHVTIPIHSHPHEQVGYVVKGHVEMTIDDEIYELTEGDSYCAPSNVPHGVYTLAESKIIDTFSPPREDYR